MKRIRTLTICMGALLLCSEVIYAQKAERKNVREGNKLYGEEKFTESEISYRKSLEVNPRSIEGTYNLGNSLYKQKKYQEAAEQYQLLTGQAEKMVETEEGKERLADVFHNLGDISMQGKDYAKSVEAFKQSLRLKPQDDETRYNLALAQKLLDEQNQEQEQDQNQNQQNEDKQENKDNKDDQQQQQDQQQDDQKENKTQQEAQQNEQMSKDNAQQMLDALLQDEKNTQEKVKKAQAQQQQHRKTDKEW
jgi:tetratricopeptide (TPR) repeat protein